MPQIRANNSVISVMTPPGFVVRGIRRAFRANPGRELTTRDRRLAVQQQASTDTASGLFNHGKGPGCAA
jgi:hypothetical protein